jgi:hypothetical protein
MNASSRTVGCALLRLRHRVIGARGNPESLSLRCGYTVASEAQLPHHLDAQGYRDIQLTSRAPRLCSPQPQRLEPQNAATLESDAAQVCWNGTASWRAASSTSTCLRPVR